MKNSFCLPSLFLGFCLSTFAGAQADLMLLVKTDADCVWRVDGHPMGSLKADHAKVVPVQPGEHVIRAATMDGLTTTRIEVEVDQGQRVVQIELKGEHEQELKRQQTETIRKQAEAEAALHPTWTDPDTGLMWAKKDNGSDVSWIQARDYCTKLQLAGHNDWRLPTLEELQGLNDPSLSSQAVVDDFGVIQVHVKGNLKLSGWIWSSSQGDASGNPTQGPWNFNFVAEQATDSFPPGFSYSMRALCVRRSGE